MDKRAVIYRIFLIVVLVLLYQGVEAKNVRDPFVSLQLDQGHQQCVMMRLRLRYTQAGKVVKAIKSTKGMLASKGWVYADERANKLWVCDIAAHIPNIKRFVQGLDIAVPQIRIYVRIVAVDQDWLQSLGIQWQMMDASNTVLTGEDRPLVQLPVLSGWGGQKLLSMISAKEQRGVVEVVANPTLMTTNNEMALIESGEELPYQEKTREGDTSTSFKSATLRLSVTPTILPNKTLRLKITLHQDKVSDLTIAGMPAIRTEKVMTSVFAHHGETVVLGGIIETHRERRRVGLPGLQRIPVLGWLFRHRVLAIKKRQLLIFVTPVIVNRPVS